MGDEVLETDQLDEYKYLSDVTIANNTNNTNDRRKKKLWIKPDYTFDCTGKIEFMRTALKCVHRSKVEGSDGGRISMLLSTSCGMFWYHDKNTARGDV